MDKGSTFVDSRAQYVIAWIFSCAVSAVEQLQVMASKRQYKEAAAQVEVLYRFLNNLLIHLKNWKLQSAKRKRIINILQIIVDMHLLDWDSFFMSF